MARKNQKKKSPHTGNRSQVAGEGRSGRPSKQTPASVTHRPASSGGPKPQQRLVMGLHSCREVFSVRPSKVVRAYVTSSQRQDERWVDVWNQIQRYRVPVFKVDRAWMDQWGSGHQGVLLEVSENPQLDWDSLAQKSESLLLALDGIEDPHNLGAILRSAWLLGADGLLVPTRRAAGLTAAVAKVASGAAEHVPIEFASTLLPGLEKAKELGYWVYGLAGEAEQNCWSFDFPKKVVLIIGAESKGLRTSHRRACDELIKIPQAEASASFNASVAAALVMGEVQRQRINSNFSSNNL